VRVYGMETCRLFVDLRRCSSRGLLLADCVEKHACRGVMKVID
jgi:hypothetical protein